MIAAVIAAATGATIAATTAVHAQAGETFSSSFTVFQHGVPLGSEQVTVDRSASGLSITSASRMGAPVDIVGRLVQVKYGADGAPLELSVDATMQGQPLLHHVVVSGSSARIEATQAGQTAAATANVPANAVLLANPFWGPYEALAGRLQTAQPGSTVPIVAGQAALIEVGASTDETIQTPARTIHARVTHIRVPAQGQMQDAEIWGDESGHLLRISLPQQGLEVVREDIASVAARHVAISRAGDEQVRIAANGFALAGTVSTPDTGGKPAPAAVLVGNPGTTDRDETVAGIPILGQLANALADAGILVVRYDKRGTGQSGGRTESAALEDYVDDLRAVLKFTADRKDVDRRRITLVGYGEGGACAMLAAAKDNRVSALVLLAAIGETGAELNMYQATHQLDRAAKPAAERQAALDLQKKIQDAVLTGKGIDALPPALRQQADTPWFHSFLAFDPARAMGSIDQPILIVQGTLDPQLPPDNAERLEALANARKRASAAEVVRIPGVNHLLVEATTGEDDEYARLPDKHISPAAPRAIAQWIGKTLPAR